MNLEQSINTIIRRIGEANRQAALEALVLSNDAEVAQIAQDGTLDTLAAVKRAAARCRRSRRRRSSDPSKRFIVREVVGLSTTRDISTGEPRVAAWKLGCGHEVPTFHRVPVTTKTKTMPCERCGSGTRTPFERRRAQERFQRSFEAMYGRVDMRDYFRNLVCNVGVMLTLSPIDKRQCRVRAELASSMKALGLGDTHDEAESA